MTHQTAATTAGAIGEYRRQGHKTLSGAERLLKLWGSLIEDYPATGLTPEQLELLLQIRSDLWDQAMSEHEAAAALFAEAHA